MHYFTYFNQIIYKNIITPHNDSASSDSLFPEISDDKNYQKCTDDREDQIHDELCAKIRQHERAEQGIRNAIRLTQSHE